MWRGAGGVDSMMCYRTTAGGSDRQLYHYTLTEHIQAFRVSSVLKCTVQMMSGRTAAICHSPRKLAHA